MSQDLETIHCPTCGARQAPQAECRRCKCDLSLVVAVLEQRRAWHLRTLRALRDGRYADALQAARRRFSISTDDDAARLLAVCYLYLGRYAAALAMYERLKVEG